MSRKINSFLRSDIVSLVEYKISDSKNMVKLDAMENPFNQDLSFNIADSFENSANLNRYPDANCERLKAILRERNEIKNNYEIIIGNGSDELIQLICLAFLKPENIVMSPAPSFSMYKKISNTLNLKFEEVFLKDDFSLDTELMLEKIKEFNPAIIFLAFPNNPTGNLWSKNDIDLIINQANGLVVIDEAYGAFAEESFLSDIDKYENLVIMRTLSKIGLAGIRVGYLIGKSSLMRSINKLRLPFNINSISQRVSEIYVENETYVDEQVHKVSKYKKDLICEMKKINGIMVYDSSTNFILFKILNSAAKDVFNNLLSNNVLIKDVSAIKGLENCLRVTVGTENENKQFIQSLKNSII